MSMDVLGALRELGGKARFEELQVETGMDDIMLDTELARLAKRGDVMETRPGLWIILE